MTDTRFINTIDGAERRGRLDPIKVLIVDPSPLSRSCMLAGLISAPDLAVDAVAEVAQLVNSVPDLVIFQGFRSGADAPQLSAQLMAAAERWPDAAVMVMAEEGDSHQILESLRNGAQAFLTSNVSLEVLIDAIHVLMHDLAVYPSDVLVLLREALQFADYPGTREGEDPAPLGNARRFENLTTRQQDVLRLLSFGLSNKVIARQLKIRESTVKVHIRAIMEHTGVNNRTQIIAHFLGRDATAQRDAAMPVA